MDNSKIITLRFLLSFLFVVTYRDTIGMDSSQHINLSNRMAAEYDGSYAQASYSTKEYMLYEEERILKALENENAEDNTVGIDIGCGTGRAILKFRHLFKRNIGIDFSEEMINTLLKKVKAGKLDNIITHTKDINIDDFDSLGIDENEKVRFVNMGFGMGSFISDMKSFLKKLVERLDTEGIAHISFYNRLSLANKTKLGNIMGFQAICNIDEKKLTVSTEGDPPESYHIPCTFYSVPEVRGAFGEDFEILDIITYPLLVSCSKDDFILNEESLKECVELDRKIAAYSEAGYYISCILKKR